MKNRTKTQISSSDQVRYTIGIMAKLLEIHPQTLRLYERVGLVQPKRAKGRRLYSNRDLDRLQTVLQLTREQGINLAGVEFFLELKDQIDDIQKDMEAILEALEESAGPPRLLARGTVKIPIRRDKNEGE